MTTIRTAAGAAALVAIALGATGCSGSDEPATPTTSTVAQPWDPCTISDEALRRATLDPATEGPGLTADPPGRKSCGWKTTDNIDVIMTAFTTATDEQLKKGHGNIDFRDVAISGYPASTYREEGDEEGKVCHLVVPLQNGGMALMQVARSVFTSDTTTTMCDRAVQIGEGLIAETPAGE